MLAFDSLVLDLIFQADAEVDPEPLATAIGGQEVATSRKILDPDMQDPRFEMELSPSFPFRRRGERRLLIIDDSVAPMREDPHTDLIVPIDLRPEKERLIALCEAAPIRMGRINALGTLADAVLVARSARDLRAIALLPWVLDPTIDVDGKKRAGRLNQAEFEAKIAAYEKRLEELDENQILSGLGPATFVRRGELLVVDVLEPDGTWDMRKSFDLEAALAGIEQFSIIPGAPTITGGERRAPEAKASPEQPRKPDASTAIGDDAEPDASAEEAGLPLVAAELGERVILVFPEGRFGPTAAAALGKRDYDAVLRRSDRVPGPVRDRVMSDGAGFVAPLEFLSEVFLDGVPLTRPRFEDAAAPVGDGARTLEVHCPRFGRALLVNVPERGHFVSSEADSPEAVLELVRSF